MEKWLRFFGSELNEMFLRACNSTQLQISSLPSYQKVSKECAEAAESVKNLLPEEQRHLAEDWFEAEASVNAEFSEALFIKGMQYGARLAALLQFPEPSGKGE